jgi:phage-related holin
MNDIQIDTTSWGWTKSVGYAVAILIGNFLTSINVTLDLVITLTVLMVLDWLTGMLKAHKVGIPITSKRSNKGLMEKSILLFIPLVIAFVAKAIGIPLGITVKTIFSMLIVAELYSLLGNCYAIYTGQNQKEYDAVTAVLLYIKDSIRKVLKGIMEEDK